MATAVSGWSAWKKVEGSTNKRRIRAVLNYVVTTTDTKVTVSTYLYAQEEGGTFGSKKMTGYLGVTDYGTVSGSGSFEYKGSSTVVLVDTRTCSWNRTTSNQTKYISSYMTMPSSSIFSGTYTVPNVAISVPALQAFTVTYNANGGEGAPGNQTKWYGIGLPLSSVVPTRYKYAFVNWNTKPDGSGVSYAPGATYTGNAALTLYAQWVKVIPDFYTKINGQWKVAEPHVKVNGEWKLVTDAYVKVDGVWKDIT